MPKKTQLSLPYMVDKRLCVGHGLFSRVLLDLVARQF